MIAWSLVLCLAAGPQIPQPSLHAVHPAGARAGTVVEVTLAGIELGAIEKLRFSHAGIRAEPVMIEPDRIHPGSRPRQGRFMVTVAKDVPAGAHWLRAVTAGGLTNSRQFIVSGDHERIEKEPNNRRDEADALVLGTIVNGSCDSENFDCFVFPAKKGLRYLITSAARAIDSRARLVMTVFDTDGRVVGTDRATQGRDARIDFVAPASASYTVRLHDLEYRGGLEYGYRLRLGAEPWIAFVDPPVVQPGRSNRLTLHGRGLREGEHSGKELETLEVTVNVPATLPSASAYLFSSPTDVTADFFEYRLKTRRGDSNLVRLLIREGPITRERPADEVQAVQIPAQLLGGFDAAGDSDWIEFTAEKGQELWVEICSHRLGWSTDPSLLFQKVVVGKDGSRSYKDLREIDDQPTPLPRMSNNMERRYRMASFDPAGLFTAPEDGRYRVLVRDLNGGARGQKKPQYLVTIRQPRPDYRLVALPFFVDDRKAAPAASVLRRGGTVCWRVVVMGREGFDGAIRVDARDLPAGVSARPLILAAGVTSGQLVVSAARKAGRFTGAIGIVGVAEIDGRRESRRARSAEVRWNRANDAEPLSLRLAGDPVLSVDTRNDAVLALRLGQTQDYRMSRGGSLKIPVELVKVGDFKDIAKAQVKLSAVGLPDQGNFRPVTAKNLTLSVAKGRGELLLAISDRAKPGRFSFNLRGDLEVQYRHDPAARVKRTADEKKRIDELAKQASAASRKASDHKRREDARLRSAQQGLARARSDAARAKSAKGADLASKEQALKKAQTDLAAVQTAQQKAIAAEREAKAFHDLANKAKRQADTDAQRAASAAKQRKIKLAVLSQPVVVEIVSAPITVKLGSGSVTAAPGGKVDLKVSIDREFGFAAPVTLDVLPAKKVDLRLAAKVEVPEGGKEAKVTIAVGKDLPPGRYPVKLRGQLTFNKRRLTVETPFEVMVTAKAGTQN